MIEARLARVRARHQLSRKLRPTERVRTSSTLGFPYVGVGSNCVLLLFVLFYVLFFLVHFFRSLSSLIFSYASSLVPSYITDSKHLRSVDPIKHLCLHQLACLLLFYSSVGIGRSMAVAHVRKNRPFPLPCSFTWANLIEKEKKIDHAWIVHTYIVGTYHKQIKKNLFLTKI